MIIMPSESNVKIIGIVIVIALMLVFSYLFMLSNEDNISLILLFIGIFLAFILSTTLIQTLSQKSKKSR